MIALAAERLSATPAGPAARTVASVDLGEFATPLAGTLPPSAAPLTLRADPLESAGPEFVVAPGDDSPSVNLSPARERQLTAILIADDRPVAVIDGSVVQVGDTLPDGARVSAIRSDRVALIERGGRWRVIPMPTQRP